jgi:hypothetical protein
MKQSRDAGAVLVALDCFASLAMTDARIDIPREAASL